MAENKLKALSVLIVDGERNWATDVVRCLGEAGIIEIHVISNRHREPVRFSRWIKSYLVCSNDIESRKSAIQTCIQNHAISIVFFIDLANTLLDYSYFKQLSERIPVCDLNDPIMLNNGVDKGAFMSLMEKLKVQVPPTLHHHDHSNLDQFIEKHGFPLLLKPRIGEGGHGIELFEKENEIESLRKKFSSDYIIQKFIPGRNYGFSAYSLNGKILYQNLQNETISGSIQFAPSKGVTIIRDEKLAKIGNAIFSDLAWSGIGHIDLIKSPEGEYFVLEMNPRYWGSLLATMNAGLNYPFISCMLASGRNVPEVNYQLRRFFTAPVYIRQWFLKWIGRDALKVKWSESELPFLMRDSGPEIYKMFKRTKGQIKKIYSK